MKVDRKVDRRIKRTRQCIKQALIKLMSEKSYASITIHDITECADINRSTFYYHYLDKEDLLQVCMDEMLEQAVLDVSMEQIIIEDTNKSTIEYDPIPFFIRMFEHIRGNAQFYRIMLDEVPIFRRRLSEVIKQQYLESIAILQPDDRKLVVSKQLLVSFVFGAYISVISYWLENNLSDTATEMAQQLSKIMMLGPHRASGLT